jgi:hypothetical protein
MAFLASAASLLLGKRDTPEAEARAREVFPRAHYWSDTNYPTTVSLVRSMSTCVGYPGVSVYTEPVRAKCSYCACVYPDVVKSTCDQCGAPRKS